MAIGSRDTSQTSGNKAEGSHGCASWHITGHPRKALLGQCRRRSCRSRTHRPRSGTLGFLFIKSETASKRRQEGQRIYWLFRPAKLPGRSDRPYFFVGISPTAGAAHPGKLAATRLKKRVPGEIDVETLSSVDPWAVFSVLKEVVSIPPRRDRRTRRRC